jgi:hypothetical protein
METKLEQIAAKAVKPRPKSVVREIRTPRSVGTGGGRPPPVTRWAPSNGRPYRNRQIGFVSRLCRLSADLSWGELRAPISAAGCSNGYTTASSLIASILSSTGRANRRPLSSRRNAAWIAVGRRLALPIEHGLLDRRVQRLARRGSPPKVFMKQIASLTVTRTRCSTFLHGSGLRRQERRATVGLGQA